MKARGFLEGTLVRCHRWKLRSYGCTYRIRIFLYATSQWWSVKLKSITCGGDFNTENWLPWANLPLFVIVELQVSIRGCVHRGINWGRLSATKPKYPAIFKWSFIYTMCPNVCHENIPPYHCATMTSNMNHWYKTVCIYTFTLFVQISDFVIRMS